MFRGTKYQLDLNKSQKALFAKAFGHTRFVYNYMLDKKIEAYKKDKIQLSWVELCKDLTVLKKENKYKWLNEIAAESLQQALIDMDNAFVNFYKFKDVGFPNFRSKYGKQSCRFSRFGIDFGASKIRLPKIGWVRFFLDKRFEGKTGAVTIKKNKAGKYFAYILVNDLKSTPSKQPINESKTIGVDVGLKHFAILSTGEKVENPKFLEKAEQRLKVLQRRLSKKQKGSNRRNAARLRYAKQHYKISCKREDFLHKLTSRLIRENQTIVIEGLNVAGMLKNHCLAKSISSASWSEFFRQLKYKADWQGKNLVTIGRFEPSSKMCSVCGDKNNSLKLSDRDWTCLNCGTAHDRDVNAAINIKNIGLKSGEAIAVEDVELPSEGTKKRQNKFSKSKIVKL